MRRSLIVVQATVAEAAARLNPQPPRQTGAIALYDHLDGQEIAMDTVTLADAKARLSELVKLALEGETIRITRRGRPVVQITAIAQPRPPIDVEALRRLTESQKMAEVRGDSFVSDMREDDRY